MEKLFDRYKLLEEIGRGKYAIIYRAIDPKTKKDLAIKAIDKAKLTQKDKRHLNNEIAITRELFHNSVARCYDVVETRNYIYLVMERVSGGELFDLLKRRTYFSGNKMQTMIRI